LTNPTTSAVCNVLREFIDQSQEINGSTKIADIKLDSLDVFEFQMKLDDLFKIEVQVDDFLTCITILDLSNLIDSLIAQKN
jgi:acyl carrier protein